MVDKGEVIHLLFFIRQIHPVKITLASFFRQSCKKIVTNEPAIQGDHICIIPGIAFLGNEHAVYLGSLDMLILNMVVFKSRILPDNHFRGIIR